MSDPKFKLYSWANCSSERPELAAISGRRVSVIGRRELEDGSWTYTVSPEAKTAATFDCLEAELQAAAPRDEFADARSFAVVRQMLGCYLHQDFDAEFDSVADALYAGIKHTDVAKLTNALCELELQPDNVVEEVMNDHDVHLWDMTTPREFLVMLKTLARLS